MAAPRSPRVFNFMLVCAGAYALLSATTTTFVSGPTSVARARDATALQATNEEKATYKLPKPDNRILNDLASIGRTVDQDKKMNAWAQPTKIRMAERENPIPAPVFFLLLVVGSVAAIIYLAQLSGSYDEIGGALGDGNTAVAD
eukprot:TRINITY_DN50929_c0_g1_i1.p1 TRINITY_DN50929_c0_g1~~TRINITY_DN50929_c0_g1_i1.p1  ORF type:complete len:144 (-),score=32.08 TRINITY_DN50929_c0_g1_i1:334-765(-)